MQRFFIRTFIQTSHTFDQNQDQYNTYGVHHHELKRDRTLGNLKEFACSLLKKQGFVELTQYIKKVSIIGRKTNNINDEVEYNIAHNSIILEDLQYLYVMIVLKPSFTLNIMHVIRPTVTPPPRTLEEALDFAHDNTHIQTIKHTFQHEKYTWENIRDFLFQHFTLLPNRQSLQFDIYIEQAEQTTSNTATIGSGAVLDMFRVFWNGAVNPTLNWFEGGTSFLPCRLTQVKSTQLFQILGRIYGSSIQHNYFPNAIHFCSYLHRNIYCFTENQLCFAIKMFHATILDAIPLYYEEWDAIPGQDKQVILSQYQLQTVIDEYELVESNYTLFRNEAYRQILVRHRIFTSEAFAKGVQDIYNRGVSSMDLLSSNSQVFIDEWQSHSRVSRHDFQNTMIQVDSSVDQEFALAHLGMLQTVLSEWDTCCPAVLARFQIFARGSLGDRRPLSLNILTSHTGLPVSFICDPVIKMKPYDCIEDMKADLERSSCELEMTLK